MHNLEDLQEDWTITSPQFEINGVVQKQLKKIQVAALAYFGGDRTQRELDFDGKGEGADGAEPPDEKKKTGKEAVPA